MRKTFLFLAVLMIWASVGFASEAVLLNRTVCTGASADTVKTTWIMQTSGVTSAFVFVQPESTDVSGAADPDVSIEIKGAFADMTTASSVVYTTLSGGVLTDSLSSYSSVVFAIPDSVLNAAPAIAPVISFVGVAADSMKLSAKLYYFR